MNCLNILFIFATFGAVKIVNVSAQGNSANNSPFSDSWLTEILIEKYSLNNGTHLEKRFSEFIGNRFGLRARNYSTQKNVSGIEIKCYTGKEILSWLSGDVKRTGIDFKTLKDICPSLLFLMDQRVCKFRSQKGKEEKEKGQENSTLLVWIYSWVAVLVISLVGLVVVWLIPIMPKAYYHSITQLLIALAVGSLTGDALLHLIPHALLTDGHSHEGKNEHTEMVWKSFIALVGIHIFFLTERITILCQNVNSKRKSRLKNLSQELSEAPAGDEVEESEKNNLSTKKYWAVKSRKYSGSNFDSYDNTDHGQSIGVQLCNRPHMKPHVNTDCPDSMNLVLCQESTDSNLNNTNPEAVKLQQQVTMVTIASGQQLSCSSSAQLNGGLTTPDSSANNILPGQPTATSASRDNYWTANESDKLLRRNTDLTNNVPNLYDEIKSAPDVEEARISKQPVITIEKPIQYQQQHRKPEIGTACATVQESLAHPFRNKPHGHHHGHSHDLSSVKAIAYTVIAGDGLHNFCDGIAIGAAFAKNLQGGLSTAIAVLCHELPHELGDFVVLLHAGMSIRTAVFYNVLSSLFCAAGMILGVLLGGMPSVSSCIFMLTAGMFLYIALVDMIPELSTRRLQGKKLWHRPSILFIWQNIGLVLGILIMLLIALYEGEIFNRN